MAAKKKGRKAAKATAGKSRVRKRAKRGDVKPRRKAQPKHRAGASHFGKWVRGSDWVKVVRGTGENVHLTNSAGESGTITAGEWQQRLKNLLQAGWRKAEGAPHQSHHSTSPGVPEAVLELEKLWDDHRVVAKHPDIRLVLQRHGVSKEEARALATPIHNALRKHAAESGHHPAPKTPATEWDRLWHNYIEANKSGSLAAQVKAGRALLRFDRTHGLPPLPDLTSKLREAKQLLEQHGEAFGEAKAFEKELAHAERAMERHQRARARHALARHSGRARSSARARR